MCYGPYLAAITGNLEVGNALLQKGAEVDVLDQVSQPTRALPTTTLSDMTG